MDSIINGMLIVLTADFAAEIIKNVCLAKLQAKMSVSSSSSFMWHILRLSVEFFSQRFTEDIASRQQSNNAVAFALCNQIAPVVLNLVWALFLYWV